MMYQVNSEEKILILKKKPEHYVHLDNYVLGTGASLLLYYLASDSLVR